MPLDKEDVEMEKPSLAEQQLAIDEIFSAWSQKEKVSPNLDAAPENLQSDEGMLPGLELVDNTANLREHDGSRTPAGDSLKNLRPLMDGWAPFFQQMNGSKDVFTPEKDGTKDDDAQAAVTKANADEPSDKQNPSPQMESQDNLLPIDGDVPPDASTASIADKPSDKHNQPPQMESHDNLLPIDGDVPPDASTTSNADKPSDKHNPPPQQELEDNRLPIDVDVPPDASTTSNADKPSDKHNQPPQMESEEVQLDASDTKQTANDTIKAGNNKSQEEAIDLQLKAAQEPRDVDLSPQQGPGSVNGVPTPGYTAAPGSVRVESINAPASGGVSDYSNAHAPTSSGYMSAPEPSRGPIDSFKPKAVVAPPFPSDLRSDRSTIPPDGAPRVEIVPANRANAADGTSMKPASSSEQSDLLKRLDNKDNWDAKSAIRRMLSSI